MGSAFAWFFRVVPVASRFGHCGSVLALTSLAARLACTALLFVAGCRFSWWLVGPLLCLTVFETRVVVVHMVIPLRFSVLVASYVTCRARVAPRWVALACFLFRALVYGFVGTGVRLRSADEALSVVVHGMPVRVWGAGGVLPGGVPCVSMRMWVGAAVSGFFRSKRVWRVGACAPGWLTGVLCPLASTCGPSLLVFTAFLLAFAWLLVLPGVFSSAPMARLGVFANFISFLYVPWFAHGCLLDVAGRVCTLGSSGRASVVRSGVCCGVRVVFPVVCVAGALRSTPVRLSWWSATGSPHVFHIARGMFLVS